MNTVCLIGRLVADPELKYTPSGNAVCNFRVAVDRRFKSESGEKQTDFFDVVAWRQSAEFAAKYLNKGRLVSITGTLQQRSWVQQDGQKRSKVEVVADQLQGLDKAQDSRLAEPPNLDEPRVYRLGDLLEEWDTFAEEAYNARQGNKPLGIKTNLDTQADDYPDNDPFAEE